jgi:lactam utilization protein B
MKHPLTPGQDAELLDYIQAIDRAIGWVAYDEIALRDALTRAAEFLVDLREQRHNGEAA